MQIGWADKLYNGHSRRGRGVGDHSHSWAYDGLRCKKWNTSATTYGHRWKVGDVIGCMVDLGGGGSPTTGTTGGSNGDGSGSSAADAHSEDGGTAAITSPSSTKDTTWISFFCNGEDLGVAFSNIRIAGVLHPAVSLNLGQAVRFNFGESSFRFPPRRRAPNPKTMAGSSGSSKSNGHLAAVQRTLPDVPSRYHHWKPLLFAVQPLLKPRSKSSHAEGDSLVIDGSRDARPPAVASAGGDGNESLADGRREASNVGEEGIPRSHDGPLDDTATATQQRASAAGNADAVGLLLHNAEVQLIENREESRGLSLGAVGRSPKHHRSRHGSSGSEPLSPAGGGKASVGHFGETKFTGAEVERETKEEDGGGSTADAPRAQPDDRSPGARSGASSASGGRVHVHMESLDLDDTRTEFVQNLVAMGFPEEWCKRAAQVRSWRVLCVRCVIHGASHHF